MKPKAKAVLKTIITFLAGLFAGIFAPHAKHIVVGGEVASALIDAIPEKEDKPVDTDAKADDKGKAVDVKEAKDTGDSK
jgi:hypothetical protein